MLKHWKLVIVAGSLLIGGVALAQPSGSDQGSDPSAHHWKDGQGKDGKRGKRGDRRASMIAKYDANKDGKLDAGEKTAMEKDKFARLDKNHDGVLSFDEAQRLLGGQHRGGRGGKMKQQP